MATSSIASERPHHRQVTLETSSCSVLDSSTRCCPARSKCQYSVVRRVRVTSNRVRFPHPPQRQRLPSGRAEVTVTPPTKASAYLISLDREVTWPRLTIQVSASPTATQSNNQGRMSSGFSRTASQRLLSVQTLFIDTQKLSVTAPRA